jgi:hypothetical protein
MAHEFDNGIVSRCTLFQLAHTLEITALIKMTSEIQISVSISSKMLRYQSEYLYLEGKYIFLANHIISSF